jgi:hypothetical protein
MSGQSARKWCAKCSERRSRVVCARQAPPAHRFDDVELTEAHEDLQEAGSRAIDEQRIADGLLQSQALLHVPPRIGIAGKEASPSQFDQRARDFLSPATRAPQRHGLFDSGPRRREIATPGRNFAGGRERPCTCFAGFRADRQNLRQPPPPFAEMRMQVPEPSKCAGEPQSAVRIPGAQVVQRRAQIVMLALQLVETRLVVVPAPRVGPLRDGLEIGGMARADGIGIIPCEELFQRELADGFEHAESFTVAADHAPVDQRRDRCDIGVAHCFRGLSEPPVNTASER